MDTKETRATDCPCADCGETGKAGRELTEIRGKIDGIDEQLLHLFLERMTLAKNVSEIKASQQLPVLNKGREREILQRVCGESGELDAYTHRLFTTLFDLSRAYQTELLSPPSKLQKMIQSALSNRQDVFPASGVIACQGIEGAYSQLAADHMFPRGNLVYVKTFEGVFDAVESGLCQFGILPVENSSNGSVRAVYDLLRERRVHIIRSERLCIRHELLVKPGTDLSRVTTIYSHEQAIGQCSDFLKGLSDRVKIVPCGNTAVAAKMVAESDEAGAAAISSHNCAELYGLETLDTPIQNSENNYTRFICITKDPVIFSGANRISLIFACEHKPGALYEILALLAAAEINLLKLESCPIVGSDFEFMFFFELEASVFDPKVVATLGNLERCCRELIYLGNYAEM